MTSRADTMRQHGWSERACAAVAVIDEEMAKLLAALGPSFFTPDELAFLIHATGGDAKIGMKPGKGLTGEGVLVLRAKLEGMR